MRRKQQLYQVEVRGVYVRTIRVWAKSKDEALKDANKQTAVRGDPEDYQLLDPWGCDEWRVWAEVKD